MGVHKEALTDLQTNPIYTQIAVERVGVERAAAPLRELVTDSRDLAARVSLALAYGDVRNMILLRNRLVSRCAELVEVCARLDRMIGGGDL